MIRPALYAENLQRKNSDALGFIPRSALQRYEHNNQIIIETEGGDECGFLIYGKRWPDMTIAQACIDYDVRRQKHGMNLVDQLITIAKKRHESITLRCRENLDANRFWKASGFNLIGSVQGGSHAGTSRMINIWKYDVKEPFQLRLI
jgi:ribosomal protein S18 acetylase RimI-like enzyme|tara:strand:+ start:2044 stop:2484 length:441 start_codon:yes stop_codon:yes gene_type:complete